MKNILVVEDDQSFIDVYKEKLNKEEFNLFIASTGKEAENIFMKEEINLILLDIMLPGDMNGFDLLEVIKKNPKLEKIPVIVITNLDSEEKTAKEIGANAYFVKANTPINEVIEKVKSLLI